MGRKGRVLERRVLKFANAFLEGRPPGECARLAGYEGDGNSLQVSASRLLRSPEMQSELARRRALTEFESTAKQAEVERRLTEIIRGEIGNYFIFQEIEDPITKIKHQTFIGLDLHRMKEDGKMYLLAGVEFGEHGPKYKFERFMDAVDKLAKLRGWIKPEGTSTTNNIMAVFSETEIPFIKAWAERKLGSSKPG